jgi:hypothetical protein
MPKFKNLVQLAGYRGIADQGNCVAERHDQSHALSDGLGQFVGVLRVLPRGFFQPSQTAHQSAQEIP